MIYIPYFIYVVYSIKIYFEVVKFQVTYSEKIISKFKQVFFLNIIPIFVITIHIGDITLNLIEFIKPGYGINIYVFEGFFFFLNLIYLFYAMFFRFVSKLFYRFCFISEVRTR